MQSLGQTSFGSIDNSLLTKSVGVLNPVEPFTLPERSSIREGIEGMIARNIGSVLLVDEESILTGIFTDRDVMKNVSLADPKILDQALSTTISSPLESISMTTSIAHGLNMMCQGEYRHLPIVDDANRPIGVISVKDIVDYLCESIGDDLINANLHIL